MLVIIFACLIMFILAGLCFLISYQFKQGKWLHLMAGYNDLTSKQKTLVNTKYLSTLASRSTFVGGVYITIIGVSLLLIDKIPFVLPFILIITTLFLVYIIREALIGNKYISEALVKQNDRTKKE